MDAEIRALAAAVELLRQQMADLPQALIDNMSRTRPTRDPDRTPAGEGGGVARTMGRAGSAAGALALSFARLLGPLAALHTFLSSSASGFNVFNKAISLFAATLAPVLLPAFFLLAVALAAASEILWTRLAPALEQLFGIVISSGIPTIVRFVELLAVAADALATLSRVPGAIASVGSVATNPGALPATGGLSGILWASGAGGGSADGGAAGDGGGGILGGALAAGRAGGAPGAPGRPGGRPPEVRRAVADTLAELRLSMGPAASSGNISGVYSRAQMAALNQSPFERRMLEIAERTFTILARAAADEPGSGRLPADSPEARTRAALTIGGGFLGALFGGRR